MAVSRYSSKSKVSYGVSGIKSGLDGNQTSEYSIPSVGIEDVDISLFQLFDKEISFTVSNKSESVKVPVIFASGEKWALLKKGKAMRDKNSSLILPLVTILRTGVAQNMTSDIAGRGINQQTGELIIKRRLDKSDRSYQNLLNKIGIENQFSHSHNRDKDIHVLGDTEQGALLTPDLKNNVFEIFAIPSPQFYTATYDITIWTQYTQHMNQIVEQLMVSFLPQGQCWKLQTEKGYWFVASVQEGNFASENNFDEMSQEERIIKTNFTVTVPAYVFASKTPGAPVPVKRYVSAPTITFDVGEDFDASNSIVEEPFLGADDPTLPTAIKTSRLDQRENNSTRLYPSKNTINENDPAYIALGRNKSLARFKKVSYTNSRGEKVVRHLRYRKNGELIIPSDFDLEKLEIILSD
jgi:hypothetical protein